MNKICYQVFWISLFCIFPSAYIFAESSVSERVIKNASYADYLQQGRQSFERGDYAQAKGYFERALEELPLNTKPSAALYYNLGSTCYKLEQYDESGSYFKKLLDEKKFSALAYYNLALIENKKDNKTIALHYFNRSKKASTDPQFNQLVEQQITNLKKQRDLSAVKKTSTTVIKDWNAYLFLSTGYDSNINFAPLGIASSDSGYFVQTTGVFDKLITEMGVEEDKSALFVTSSVFMSNYFATDFNDYNLYDIGLRYAKPVQGWKNTIDINLTQSTYGHDNYQRSYNAAFRTYHQFSGGDILRSSYRYAQIESLNPLYDYLQGNQQKFRLGYQFLWPEDSVYVWYELELNNRRDTERSNFSPTRNTFRLRYEKKFDVSNSVYAEFGYRRSDYEATPFQDRLDNRSVYQLAYVNDLSPDWQLLLRWEYTSNRSDEPVYTYNRHVTMLTLRKIF